MHGQNHIKFISLCISIQFSKKRSVGFTGLSKGSKVQNKDMNHQSRHSWNRRTSECEHQRRFCLTSTSPTRISAVPQNKGAGLPDVRGLPAQLAQSFRPQICRACVRLLLVLPVPLWFDAYHYLWNIAHILKFPVRLQNYRGLLEGQALYRHFVLQSLKPAR